MARKKRRKRVVTVPVTEPQLPKRRERLKTLWTQGSVLPALIIFGLTLVAYVTAMAGGYIWDDPSYLTQNPLLYDLDGLRRIWFTTETPQYYPIVFTTFWIEKQLWGADPFGYHLVNVLLHAGNAVILWRLLRYLEVPGAWLAGLVFALHPVHVESVAWITELKNVLSGMFYLLALFQYLKWEAGLEPGFWKNPYRYAGAFALFVCALLSKSVTATLPAVIPLILWYRGRLDPRAHLRLIPFFVVGAISGLFTAWLEIHKVGASGEAWSLNLFERFLLAGEVVWFYLWKLLWPVNLAFSYPKWEVDMASPIQYLGILGVIAVGITLSIRIRRWGRGPATAALFFVITLAPVLGFLNVYPMLFSWVADHFQYLASIGPIALVTGGAVCAWHKKAASLKWGAALAAAILAVLGSITWLQGQIYENSRTLWEDTLQKNPRSWMAHNNLGNYLANDGKYKEAILHYRESLKRRPTKEYALNNIGNALYHLGKTSEAIDYYRQAIKINPKHAKALAGLGQALVQIGKIDEGIQKLEEALRILPGFPTAHNNLGIALAKQGKVKEAAHHFLKAIEGDPRNVLARFNLANALYELRRYGQAIRVLRDGVRIHPNDNQMGSFLALLLATVPNPELRNGHQAYVLARKSLNEGRPVPRALNALAASYAELGRYAEAVETARRALRQAEILGAREEAALANEFLSHYEQGRPYRFR